MNRDVPFVDNSIRTQNILHIYSAYTVTFTGHHACPSCTTSKLDSCLYECVIFEGEIGSYRKKYLTVSVPTEKRI